MKWAFPIAATIFLSLVLLNPAIPQSQSQQPPGPDATLQTPATPAQSTPPTFPQTKVGGETPDPGQRESGQQSQAQPKSETERGAARSPSGEAVGETFTGEIILSNDKYVLRTGGREYKLDDQTKAKQFAGKAVKVKGTLERQMNMIRVESIDLAPAL